MTSVNIDARAKDQTGVRFDFTGVRVLVTGGSRGIGRAIADEFVAAGASVLVAARTPGGAPQDEPRRMFVPTDMTDPASIAALADRVPELLGGLDVLVNNAGSQTWNSDGVLRISDADWRADLEANLLSSVRLDRALVPAMIAQGHGVVIHVTSVQARMPASGQSLPYATAKAALTMYSKGLANDVGRHGVRVNAVAPGLLETEGAMSRLAEAAGVDPGARADLAVARRRQIEGLGVPLGRGGVPADAARLVAFLASPAACFITGGQFVVDGGITPTV